MNGDNAGPAVRESFFDYGGNYIFRRSTFKRWPYQKEDNICHPIFMSMEWWRSSGDSDVNCVICQKELEGWEENDDPFLEHKKHSKMCPVVIAHTFLSSLPVDVLDTIKSETKLKEAYTKWIQSIEMIALPGSILASPEIVPPTVVQKGKKGRTVKKSALKTANSARNLLSGIENECALAELEDDTKTQRKQPQRQVKGTTTTLKKGGFSVPNLMSVKKSASQTKPSITYNELVQSLESIADSVTEKHLILALLDRVRASGSITS